MRWKLQDGVGKVVVWGTRVLIEVYARDPQEGKVVQNKIYKGPDPEGSGKRVRFRDKGHAEYTLAQIRFQIAQHPNSASQDPLVKESVIWSVLAQYMPGKLRANLVKVRWREFLLYREKRAEKRPVVAEYARHFERTEARGYLDFFHKTVVGDLTQQALENWVSWLMMIWPPPPPTNSRRRQKPTPEQQAAGVRGFHKPKTRSDIVAKFMLFEQWLVQQKLVPRALPLSWPLLPSDKVVTHDDDEDVEDELEDAEVRVEGPTIELLERYLAAIPEEIRGLFLSRSIRGLRPSEARRMRVRNYDWQTRVLTIRRGDTKTAAGARRFEVDEELGEWLDRFVPLEERVNRVRPLFINPNVWKPCALASKRAYSARKGKPEPRVDGRWKEDAEAAVHQEACSAIGLVDGTGFPLYPPNVMGRHAAVTHMLMRTKENTGVYDVENVRDIAGHKDSRTTRRYTHIQQTDVAAVTPIRPRPLDPSKRTGR